MVGEVSLWRCCKLICNCVVVYKGEIEKVEGYLECIMEVEFEFGLKGRG